VKRSISVRRVEPLADAAPAAPEPPQEQPERSAPVRRIAVGRTGQPAEPALNGSARAVSEHSNGVHRPDDEKA
jgi:hypothetical protein